MALGYIAAFSETLAMAVISEKAVLRLVAVVKEDPQEFIKAAAVWGLGQVRQVLLWRCVSAQ
jgi:hypothetical protein